MSLFAYTGRSVHGELVKGSLEGTDSGAIANHLFNIGITPLQIEPTERAPEAARAKVTLRIRRKITSLDLMLFSRMMYTLIKAGVPIMTALAGLKESAQNPAFADLMEDLRDNLDNGLELSIAMRRHPKVFTPFYISMVQIGEMTGMMEETFIRLAEHIEFERQMRDNIKSAVRYPAFVVFAMIVAFVVLNILVIPAFAKVFERAHAQLPWLTRTLISLSDFMVHYWLYIAAVIAGMILAFRVYIATVPGRYQWDKYKLRLPIAGKILMKATLARFARSFALAFKSGIPIVQGLNVVGMVVDNEFMRTSIEQMRDGVERGESISRTARATGVFNEIVMQMISVGEETGEMDDLMFEIAAMYEREVEYDVRTLSAQIEPILVAGLGVMVLILALGIFLPIWDLGKAMLHK
jgi:MSHA biogenesis protein MshG